MSALMLRIFTNVMQGLKTSLVFPLTACCSASFTAFKQCFLKEKAGFLRKVTGHIRLFFFFALPTDKKGIILSLSFFPLATERWVAHNMQLCGSRRFHRHSSYKLTGEKTLTTFHVGTMQNSSDRRTPERFLANRAISFQHLPNNHFPPDANLFVLHFIIIKISLFLGQSKAPWQGGKMCFLAFWITSMSVHSAV